MRISFLPGIASGLRVIVADIDRYPFAVAKIYDKILTSAFHPLSMTQPLQGYRIEFLAARKSSNPCYDKVFMRLWIRICHFNNKQKGD